jgi:hypothetical protein
MVELMALDGFVHRYSPGPTYTEHEGDGYIRERRTMVFFHRRKGFAEYSGYY